MVASIFNNRTSAAILVTSLLTFTPAAANSADHETPGDRVDSSWEFVVAPYFFGANIVGTSQIGRIPATDLDVSTGTILENLHFGGMVHTEALYQHKFGAILDLAYLKLGSATDTPAGGGRVRMNVKQTVVEAFGTYRFFDNVQTNVEAYAGGRYWDMSVNVNASATTGGTFNRTYSDTWIDPVVGLRAIHQINDKWSVRARGDIGGFGVGSDFTWNAQAGVGYHFSETWSAHLQYKALSVDFDNNKAGAARFSYDTITHGPLIGVAAKF